jgi:hypothetical protein
LAADWGEQLHGAIELQADIHSTNTSTSTSTSTSSICFVLLASRRTETAGRCFEQ